MRRDLSALENGEFDLVVVGGGIFGACAAWDAALRGLRVALLEQSDFGAGVSANSFKMVHGGIRYLQHGDLVRLRASCHERSAFLRIAPHLVRPLPIVIPTWGHGKKGKAYLGAGMLLYDLLTPDRNRGIGDPDQRIPFSEFWSRAELLDRFPSLESDDLTGAAIFRDGQMYNPTRLVLAFVRSAHERGAVVANRVRAERLEVRGGRVAGVWARDLLGGNELRVRARTVINAAGPWAESVDGRSGVPVEEGTYSRDTCFLVRRRFPGDHALAVQGRTRDPDALLARPARHLFLVPWRDYTLVGVWHVVWKRGADHVRVSEEELSRYLEEINQAHAGLDLGLQDITIVNAGLVPFGESNEPGQEDLSYGKRSRLVDHGREGGPEGLVTLIGIRYTMGRRDAARAVDGACRVLGWKGKRPRTDWIPVKGGEFSRRSDLEREAAAACPGLDAGTVAALVRNHGTGWREVVGTGEGDHATPLPGSTVLEAEVLHALRHEMAETLTDIVFRRTDLATGGDPGDAALRRAAQLAARERGWDPARTARELERVRRRFPRWEDGRLHLDLLEESP